ncbi:DENN domain-containing protein 5B [Balamuthia mandrillaris]
MRKFLIPEFVLRPSPSTRRRGYTARQNENMQEVMELVENCQSERRKRSSTALSPFIHSEIEKRTTFGIGMALAPPREGLLFEAFLVVGYPREDVVKAAPGKQRPAEVQFLYPEGIALPNPLVAQFCFPGGVKPSYIPRSDSMTAYNTIMYSALAELEQSSHSYVFTITGSDVLLYGICVSKNELLTKTKKRRPDKLLAAPRCYCLLSRFPFFQLHFEILYSILVIYLLSFGNFFQAEERSNMLAAVSQESSSSSSSALEESSVIRLLKEFQTVQLTAELENIGPAFSRGPALSFTFSCPSGSEEDRIGEWCFASTGRLFSLPDIVRLFKAVMMEYKIVVVCSNLGILSRVAMSLIPLMRPFVWQGPFIPILPASLAECLESPVPYIIGVQELQEEKMRAIGDEAVSVRVDEGEVIIPEALPLPAFPGEDNLARKLKKTHAVLQRRRKNTAEKRQDKEEWYLHPSKATEEELSAVREILSTFMSYQMQLIKDVCSYANANSFNFSQKECLHKLVECFPMKFRDFYSRFFCTQTFSVYTAKIVPILYKQDKEETSVLLERVEKMIHQEESQKASAASLLKLYETEKGTVDLAESERKALKDTVTRAESRLRALLDAKEQLCKRERLLEEAKQDLENL